MARKAIVVATGRPTEILVSFIVQPPLFHYYRRALVQLLFACGDYRFTGLHLCYCNQVIIIP
jgi:hypothetical protein